MAAGKPLHIAWLGSAPVESGSAPGVATEILHGLASRGHQIDCFFPGSGVKLPPRIAEAESVTVTWGNSSWRWNRWYSRTPMAIFASGLFARSVASVRLRREVIRRHRESPYDLLFQLSSIESLSAPRSLMKTVPLVIRPDSHQAGELRCLLDERELSMRCQPPHVFVLSAAIMSVRSLVQRVRIRRASLLVCLSSVFRDHMVNDYRFPIENTVVITNPVRLEQFGAADLERELGEPPIILVPGRVSVRKGIEDVVAVAKLLRERNIDARVRVVGGPSLWSDYTKLLEDLPDNAEYVEHVPSAEMPAEFARSDVMLQASKYDPCPMTVIEALAGGVPVVATSEVGSIEGVDRSVVAEVRPGDVEGMVTAITEMLERLRTSPVEMRTMARAEAERLFAPEVVCEQISSSLERLAGAATV
jgi:glycosyltransferase involved in cell wall biosynthesis